MTLGARVIHAEFDERPADAGVAGGVPRAEIRRSLVSPERLLRRLGGGLDTTDRWWAFAVFVVAMMTDRIDGDLARKYGLITDFGKIADPIADKALMIGALVGLNIIGLLPWWITAIIVVRELGITFWRMFQLRAGHVVPASKVANTYTLPEA